MAFITEEEMRDRLSRSPFGGKPTPPPADILVDEPIEAEEVVENEQPTSLEVRQHHFRGRTAETTNIPDFLKPIIAASAVLSGVSETAKAFDIAPSTASGYGNEMAGGTSHTNKPMTDEQIEKKEAILGQAKDLAAERMMSALGLLDENRINRAKPKEIATIAKDMASIVEKLSPKQGGTGGGLNIVILAPATKTEAHYDIVPSV